MESVQTLQTQIQQNKTTTQEYSFNDSALLLSFRLSQLFGIQPITIKKLTSKSYRVSISLIVYVINILICFFINGAVFHGLFLKLTKENHQNLKLTPTSLMEIHNLILEGSECFLAVLNVFYTLSGIIRAKRILDCLESIQKIKQGVSNDSYQFLGNRRKMCLIILFGIFGPIIDDFTKIGFHWKYFYQYVCTISSVTVVLFEVQFLLMVDSLNSSFEAINKKLKEILSHLNFYYIKRIHKEKLSLRIDHLMISFVKSCNMLKKINSNESLLLLCHVILFPLYVIFCLHYFFQTVLNNEDAISTLFSFCRQTFSNCIILFILCFIIQPCHQTQKKVNETKLLIAEIMCHIKSEDDPIFDSVDIFYKQLLLNHYAFTAMGICNIDMPLIPKILGLAFTLNMVIQF